MDFMLKQLLIVLVLLAVTPYIVGIVLALLAKLRLLPLAVCGLVLSCLPNWVAAHRPLAIGLLAACALYPIVYWTLRFIRWRQEERYYAHYLLATAKPLYAPAEYEDYDNKEEYGYNA